MNITFIVNGQASALINQVMATGSSSSTAYNHKTAVATYSKSTSFNGGIGLTGNGKTLTSIASATATSSTGQRTVNASAAIGSLSLTVKNGTAVLMKLTSMSLSSKASVVATQTSIKPSGSTSIGGITINSTAFGASNVKYSGTPLPNKVLFKSKDGTVTIYANRRTVTLSGGKPAKIEIDGVSVQFNKFRNAGKTITGNIKIATSIAQ
jgi:hypothetical protein